MEKKKLVGAHEPAYNIQESASSMPVDEQKAAHGVDPRPSAIRILPNRSRWLEKLANESASGHLWTVLLTTSLLLFGKLDSASWVTVILAVAGMRHAAEFGEAYNGKDNATDDSKSGE